MPPITSVKRLRARLVRDLLDLDARHRLEELDGDVAGRAAAGGRVLQLAGVRLARSAMNSFRLLHAERLAHEEDVRRLRDLGDRARSP